MHHSLPCAVSTARARLKRLCSCMTLPVPRYCASGAEAEDGIRTIGRSGKHADLFTDASGQRAAWCENAHVQSP